LFILRYITAEELSHDIGEAGLESSCSPELGEPTREGKAG
jgi:hypothetical protein